MDALIVLGLAGVGYMANKYNDDESDMTNTSTPIIDIKNSNLNNPSNLNPNLQNSNVYNVNNFKNTKHIDNQNAREFLNKGLNTPNIVLHGETIPPEEEPSNAHIFSNISENYMKTSDFLKNDKGIQIQPFFGKAPKNVHFDNNIKLESHRGNSTHFQSKKADIEPMFKKKLQ